LLQAGCCRIRTGRERSIRTGTGRQDAAGSGPVVPAYRKGKRVLAADRCTAE